MAWLRRRIADDRYFRSLEQIRRMLAQARKERIPWGEADTIRLLVVPVLELLDFHGSEIRQTVPQIENADGNRRRADLWICRLSRSHVVFEAKSVSKDLALREPGGRYPSPLMQGLTYLHDHDATFCIVTNGVEWYLLQADPSTTGRHLAPGNSYLSVRFSLAAIIAERDIHGHLQLFLEMLSRDGLSSGLWPDDDLSHYEPLDLPCVGGTVTLRLRDTTGQRPPPWGAPTTWP